MTWKGYVNKNLLCFNSFNKAIVRIFRQLLESITVNLFGEIDTLLDYNQLKQLLLYIPFENETRKYTVWGRDLWDWAMDLLLDTHLTQHWCFDSLRLFKWNGMEWVRFRHEPWTANLMWNVQVS